MANRKGEIVDAAIRRIAEEGGTFTTGQIAADVGCSQSLIFRYYHTKEGLMSACFDCICHELKLILKEVELPRMLTKETVGLYMVNVWKTYCEYLESNSHIAKAYMYFVSTGRRYPHGYRSAEVVLRRILEDDYDRISYAYPDFRFVAEYIILMSNAIATGKFIDWKKDRDAAGKLDRILMYGVLGMNDQET